MSKQIRCHLCNAELNRNIIGLNKKLCGRNMTPFYCINCLADYLEVTADELFEKIEEFKAQGCTLFQ